MAQIVFDPKQGQLVVSSEDRKAIDNRLKAIFRSGDIDAHKALGEVIVGPIRAMVAYNEWCSRFFIPKNVTPGEFVRIKKPTYFATAYYTSPDGQTTFVRPGHKYGTISWSMIDTGIELHWDDMESGGYEGLAQYMSDASEELARKRDDMALTVIDAGIAGLTGHVIEVSGAMTKKSVDVILRAAAAGPFNLTFAVINPGRAMDMTDWVWSNTNSLWLQIARGDEVLRNGYIGNYGGIPWVVNKSVSQDYVYFGTDPGNVGWHFTMGGTRSASDTDIIKKLDRHMMDEKHSYNVENATGLYQLVIT